MSLADLIDNNRTNINTHYSYLDTFQLLFSNKKETTSNVLEIGTSCGMCGSIKLWHDYFPNAIVYGLDDIKIEYIFPDIKEKDKIVINTPVDSHDPGFIKTNFSDNNIKFDIILDTLITEDLAKKLTVLDLYLPLLKENGILILENIQSPSWFDDLTTVCPEELKPYIEKYDFRDNKKKYDDLLFVINKSKVL
jgi:hypothetical protein